MREIIDAVTGIIQRYGMDVTLETGESTVEYKAFICPVSRSGTTDSPLIQSGLYDDSTASCYASAPEGAAIEQGNVLRALGKRWLVSHVNRYYIGDTLVYTNALLQGAGAEEGADAEHNRHTQ